MKPMRKLLISVLLIFAIAFNVTSCDLLASKVIDVEGFISSIINRGEDENDGGAGENIGTDGEDGKPGEDGQEPEPEPEPEPDPTPETTGCGGTVGVAGLSALAVCVGAVLVSKANKERK